MSSDEAEGLGKEGIVVPCGTDSSRTIGPRIHLPYQIRDSSNTSAASAASAASLELVQTLNSPGSSSLARTRSLCTCTGLLDPDLTQSLGFKMGLLAGTLKVWSEYGRNPVCLLA